MDKIRNLFANAVWAHENSATKQEVAKKSFQQNWQMEKYANVNLSSLVWNPIALKAIITNRKI